MTNTYDIQNAMNAYQHSTTDIRPSVKDSTPIHPAKQTTVRDSFLWDLRGMKEVTIPDGAAKIGNNWFYGCDVESVTIPASVE